MITHTEFWLTRCLIDPPYGALGYLSPETYYHPFEDKALGPEEGHKLFPLLVSGYYAHGETPDKLEHRFALTDSPPTITTMSETDIATALYSISDMSKFPDIIILSAIKPCLRESLPQTYAVSF